MQSEHIRTSTHARPAVYDDVPASFSFMNNICKMLPELGLASPGSALVKHLLPEAVSRSWNMPCAGIDRLFFADITLRFARIHQQCAACPGGRGFAHLADVSPHAALRMSGERLRNDHLLLGVHGITRRLPCGEAFAQHVDLLMPGIAQQPPEPRGVHAALIVVSYDSRLRANPGLAKPVLQRFQVRQGMASAMRLYRS
ncbi:hypothetical protein D3C72_673840 [compost metagenome]